MKRRTFLEQGSLLTTAFAFRKLLPSSEKRGDKTDASLYSIFKNPDSIYKPYVRWWWNGDKIDRDELARELRMLKEIGIGGVEINPIKFPARTNDLGKRSLDWLSPEWIEMLRFTFEEAKSLGITCDLLVGSGWPFGAEWLEREERSQVVVIVTKKIEGPINYEISFKELFAEASPSISSPFPGQQMEMLSVKLSPSVIDNIDDVKDISDQIPNGIVKYKIEEGKYILYALVKINGFMQVIQGAPGATGPVLNHYNEGAVKKFLAFMSDKIGEKLGPLSPHIRSFFSDSLELEGANWCTDMPGEFQKRRGYELMPWLPFLLFKITAMGNTLENDNGAEYHSQFNETIQRIRYDFELTKAELIKERFLNSFVNWCKENGVKSRMQSYGRGYFPLEGSLEADIPECETWIRPGLGAEMNETDYRVGRAYTMVNKYVTSAAHLKGKKHISCEELTNIHMVFNETLELMKIAGDQSIVSGTTHPIFHGFNFSPPDALFPGWVIYGSFINERNPWWPSFHYFIEYKTRLSALLQQATFFADIAILPATADLWSIYGAQNDPFPAVMHPSWQTLVWEAIHQNGNACDYISELIIRDAVMQNGYMQYGPRKYHTIFLTQVESLDLATAKKLLDFVVCGGRVLCIETYPHKAVGWKDHEQRDRQVQDYVNNLKNYPDHFMTIKKPDNDFTGWYKRIQEKFSITPYVRIDSPNPFITQVRYQAKDTEILLFANSNMNESYEIEITPSRGFISQRQPWIWNAENGERYKLATADNKISLDMGPADLKLVVLDKEKKGDLYKHDKSSDSHFLKLVKPWALAGQHVDGTLVKDNLDLLKDLKEVPQWKNFCGNIIYSTVIEVPDETKMEWMNLGKVFGVSELSVNGEKAGTKWYGRRIFPVAQYLKKGYNNIEVKITTTMGNYLKSLTDNQIAQFWTNEGRTIQPLQSMGLLGPVTIY